MRTNEKPFSEKKFGICIGPIGDDPNDIIETVLEISRQKNEGREIKIKDKKISPDHLFLTFTVSSSRESRAITEFNGINNLLISQLDFNSWEKTREVIQSNFPDMVHDHKTINLSNLPELGVTCNLCFPQNTSFILFYSALLCQQEKIQIKKLIFKGNNIRDLKGFYSISVFFPDLKKIIIPTNVEVNDIFTKAYKIIRDDSSDYSLIQENYWDKIGFPIVSHPNTLLTDPSIANRSIHYDLNMYQPIKLSPTSRGNTIIIEFYKCAWHSIESLIQFYVIDAAFSITVNYHSPNSPLGFYDKFSRNLLFANNTNNYIVGSENIVFAQKELFGNHFYAYVTSISEMVILPQYISIITHGVFQLNNDVMGFDRTMNVVFSENQSAIVNDHIFIRSPEKIQ